MTDTSSNGVSSNGASPNGVSPNGASADGFEPRSPALKMLIERGCVHQATNLAGLDDAFSAGIVPAYVGFDATADSLHVGHLLPIMTLRRLQQAGHKPVVLVGGGTTRIGDPSFRSETRPMLTGAQIAANIAGIGKAFDRFLTFGDGPTDAVIVDNADWLNEVRWIDMLRDVGRCFSVNRMLSFDSVKSRLDRRETLSFLEFNYMILQAYDFLELSRRMGVRLQMGGADQWGNIVNGVDLTRRMSGTEVFGLTSPLLTTAAGVKMGKTAAGAVWLNADRLSPYDYRQFWRNVEDADVGRFLRLFTDLPTAEIAELTAQGGAALNVAKERLADEAVALAHGADAAREAAETALRAFGRPAGKWVEKGRAEEGRAEEERAGTESEKTAEESAVATDGLPVATATRAELTTGVSLIDLLQRAGLAKSRGEARRAIEGRGVRLNGEIVVDIDRVLREDALPARLSLGRKRHAAIVVDDQRATEDIDKKEDIDKEEDIDKKTAARPQQSRRPCVKRR